jgi:hypothetical protein
MSVAVNKLFLDGLIEGLPSLDKRINAGIKCVKKKTEDAKAEIDKIIARQLARKLELEQQETRDIEEIMREADAYAIQIKFAEYDLETAEILARHGNQVGYERNAFTVLKIADLLDASNKPHSIVSDGIKLVAMRYGGSRVDHATGIKFVSYLIEAETPQYVATWPLTGLFEKPESEFCESTNFLIIAVNATHACFVCENNFFIFGQTERCLAVCRPQGPERCLRLVGDQLEFAECPEDYTLIDLSNLAYRCLSPARDGSFGSALFILNVFTNKEAVFPFMSMDIKRICLLRYYSADAYNFVITTHRSVKYCIGVPRSFLD